MGKEERKSHYSLYVRSARAAPAPGIRESPSVQEGQPEAIKHQTHASASGVPARWVGFA